MAGEQAAIMNAAVLASEIVSKIRNSMQDSSLNQEIMVAGMIRRAMDEAEGIWDKRNTLKNDPIHLGRTAKPEKR